MGRTGSPVAVLAFINIQFLCRTKGTSRGPGEQVDGGTEARISEAGVAAAGAAATPHALFVLISHLAVVPSARPRLAL